MKKWFLIFILVIIPCNVLGLSIKNTSITGSDTVYTMNKTNLKVKMDFDDFNDDGIAVVIYELKFNEYAFSVYDISTDGIWSTELYKDDSSYYVVSSINPGVNNRCSDGLLYCGSYEADVILYAKDTDTIYSDDISIGKIQLGLVNINYDDTGITDEDIKVVEGNGNSKKTINIKKSGVIQGIIVPKIEVSNSKPKITNETKEIKNKKTSYIKSSNNYIEDLQVEGYNLKFRSFTNDYNLTVKEGVNDLKLTVKLLSDKAKYKITGNDNLEENNNEVIIEVTAENGDKNIYTIKVDHEKEVILPMKSDEKKINWYETSYFKYGVIIFGVIILIITIINIILRIRDCKMEKDLNKL